MYRQNIGANSASLAVSFSHLRHQSYDVPVQLHHRQACHIVEAFIAWSGDKTIMVV